MKEVTTIIFDLAEVYLCGYYGIENYLEDILAINPAEIKPALQGPEFRKYMEGRINENEFWEEVISRNGWNIGSKDFKEAIRKNFVEIEGTRTIIEQLKEKGYKLGLLSDHGREWINYCDNKYDFHKLFDSVLYSFEVESMKADDTKMFNFMLEKLHEKAEDCLFVDDNPDNISVANTVGINTITFKSPKQLMEELKNFGIVLE